MIVDHIDDGFRSFGGINDDELVPHSISKPSDSAAMLQTNVDSEKDTDKDKVKDRVKSLRNSIIGTYEKFTGPYGDRPIVYADWTASGKCVSKVENYIAENVHPLYGNTHTTTSITGHQTTCFRHEARQIVAEAVNAKVTGRAAVDVVVFTGNGTTAAINKLILSLGLNTPLPQGYDETHRPVVFTSCYEHHSNLLSWRESVADVVTVQYSPLTGVCLTDLSLLLAQYSKRLVKIGAFSAASNVTGVLTDTNAVCAVIHRAGGLVFFDYATAAPYVKMDMNPVCLGDDAPFVYKDAIIFSGHKFIGGPGCPGVLVVKRAVLPAQNSLPTEPGGGTVFYVTEEHHRYLSNREEREEGGTPDILGDVKLGLVVSLKQSFGAQWIEQEELRISRYAQSRLTADRRITLLGRTGGWIQVPGGPDNSDSIHHLPIFPFLIRRGARFLHHNFVCALLNDLFGVQSRGGCQCAGPFSQQLLGLSAEDNKQIELALLDKHEVLRPGYSRFSLSYWMSQEDIDFILDAVLFVAQHGWKFLHLYRYNHKTGEWAHTSRLTRFPERKWLSQFDINSDTNSTISGITDAISAQQNRSPLEKALTEWVSPSSNELFDRIKKLAVKEVEKIELSVKPKGKKGKGLGLLKGEGAGDVVLTAFESVRWFIMTNDPDNNFNEQNNALLGGTEEGYGLMPLKGPVQPPDHPAARIDTGAPDVSASEHIDQLNRLVASLRAQLEGREVGSKLETVVKVDGPEGQGSLYAQQRSQKLCMRNGGEGTLLPRYLTIKETENPSDNSNSSKKSSHDNVKEKKILFDVSNGTMGTKQSSGGAKERANKKSSIIETKQEASLLIPTNVTSTIPVPSTSSSNATENKAIGGTGVTYTPLPHTSEGPSIVIPVPISVKPVIPPKKIMKLVGQAIKEWGMIEEGDRLLLGLSGGKDSLALLHILIALQKKAPIKFTIACATVDPQTDSFDPSPLIPYVQSLGIPYHYLSEPIVALAKTKMQGDSLCAFCSRFKRGLLYSCCRTNGYNKLVLAQHLDDLVESFLMSALHNGQVRTMKANYTIEAGDVRVIRPLVYVREKSTRDFSQETFLPVINENCPACFEEPKERDRMKKLLVQEEAMIPALFYNFKRALIPLLDDRTYVTMQAVAAAADARGRNVKDRLPSKRQDKDRQNEENKRKRSLESGQIGFGPGLFGNNSNLTNGKGAEMVCIADPVEGLDINTSKVLTRLLETDRIDEGVRGRNECVPDKKRIKMVGAPGSELIEKDEDSDDDIKEDTSICTSSYCPPCYELA